MAGGLILLALMLGQPAAGGSSVCPPESFDQAMLCFDETLSETDKDDLRELAYEGLIGTHMDMGSWIRGRWSLWSNGPLVDQFREAGVTHPDNMSGMLINAYWAKLRGCTFSLQFMVETQEARFEAGETFTIDVVDGQTGELDHQIELLENADIDCPAEPSEASG